jgi:hypothetical protein
MVTVDLFRNASDARPIRAGEAIIRAGDPGDNMPHSADAVAVTNCRVVPVDEKRFKFLVQQTPFFSLQILRVMADRLRRTTSA